MCGSVHLVFSIYSERFHELVDLLLSDSFSLYLCVFVRNRLFGFLIFSFWLLCFVFIKENSLRYSLPDERLERVVPNLDTNQFFLIPIYHDPLKDRLIRA